MKIDIKYIPSDENIPVRRVSMRGLDMDKYIQELLANTVEAMVEMYELPSGDMTLRQGIELAEIRDRLAGLLTEFVENNSI